MYKGPRRYQGYPLHSLLRRIPAMAQADPGATVVLFRAADDYAPAVLLEQVLARPGVVAFRDLDAQRGNWDTFVKRGEQIDPGPFYMVWEDIPQQPADADGYPWTYQLVSLSLAEAEEYYAAAYPDETDLLDGFKLFVKHCLSCHSINLVGGKLGPELNVPMNITEYWSIEHVRGLIRNPKTYRARTRMPAHEFFSEAELDALLEYIEGMKKQKICHEDCP